MRFAARSALFAGGDKQTVDLEALGAELNNIDLTSVEIDFEEMDAELQRCQNDPRFREALQSKNLRKYTRDIGAQLREVEATIVPTVLALGEEYTTLFEDLTMIDTVLAQFEALLDGFRTDLGSLSTDIRRLQDMSMSKSVALRNRKALRAKIGTQIHDMTLGKHMTKKLVRRTIVFLFVLFFVFCFFFVFLLILIHHVTIYTYTFTIRNTYVQILLFFADVVADRRSLSDLSARVESQIVDAGTIGQ